MMSLTNVECVRMVNQYKGDIPMLKEHRGRMIGRMSVLMASVALLGSPLVVRAQEAAGPNTGKVSMSSGFDITSVYFFRGILQEDQGIIFQPWLDATVSVTDNVDVTFGIWNSFHDAQTGAASNGTDPDSWYEADLSIGASMAVAENCSIGLKYVAITSPNDAFNTVHELVLSLSHDDSSAWDGTCFEGSGLQPSVTIVKEMQNSTFGPDEGVYLELGVSPSFTLVDSQDYPITLSVPVTVGLSVTDYYGSPTNDPNFGFFDIGVDLSMPLSAIPADFGSWEISTGLHYLYLSENTELANANGDDSEFIFTFGLSMGY